MLTHFSRSRGARVSGFQPAAPSIDWPESGISAGRSEISADRMASPKNEMLEGSHLHEPHVPEDAAAGSPGNQNGPELLGHQPGG
jgi:hypothetical protein